MQLITIVRDYKLQYYDKIRLRIDSINKELIIMPSENEIDFIYISFKRNYVHQAAFQRILCIDECDTDSNRYVLIFNNVEQCIKFTEGVKKTKAKNKLLITVSKNDEIFKSKFLTSITEECRQNASLSEKLNPMIVEFKNFYETSDKKGLKRTYPAETRRKNETYSKKQKIKPLNGIIYSPNFKVINYIRNGNPKSRLFIFPISDKTLCYEYYYNFEHELYNCYDCGHGRTAIIKQSADGKDYVKCLRTDHICKLRQFQPEKYQSDMIIKKPNYQLVEEIFRGKTLKCLLLYTSEDKKGFYKLTYNSQRKLYFCTKCCKVDSKKHITASISHDNKGNEFIYIRNQKHVCSNMKYLECEEATTVPSLKPLVQDTSAKNKEINQKIRLPYSSNPQTSLKSKIIRKPNFQLFQRNHQGKMMKKLAIFDSNDKSMCHEYTWLDVSQKYVCHTCKNYFRRHVYANVIKNGREGKEYVQMGKNGHECQLKKFIL